MSVLETLARGEDDIRESLNLSSLDPAVPIALSVGNYTGIQAFRPDTGAIVGYVGETGPQQFVALMNSFKASEPSLVVAERASFHLQRPRIFIYDIRTSEQLAVLAGHENSIGTVLPISEEKLWSCGHDTTVKLWDLNELVEIASFDDHTDPVTGLAFLPHQKWLASGSNDNTVRVFDASTARQVSNGLVAHEGWVKQVCWGGKEYSNLLCSSCFDSTVRLIDLKSFEFVHTLATESERNYTILQTPEFPHLLFAGGTSGEITVYDFRNCTEGPVACAKVHQGISFSMCFVGNGQFISCCATEIHSWDANLESSELLVSSPANNYGLCCFKQMQKD